MNNTLQNENGFTLIELLLSLVVIILIAFAGWYVYHRDHKKALTNIATKTSSQTLFTFTNLGISFQLPGSLSGLSYTPGTYTSLTNDTTEPEAEVTIPSFRSLLESDCSPKHLNFTYFAIISKDTGVYPQNPTPENSDGALFKQFSGFYISGAAETQMLPCANMTRSQQNQWMSTETKLVSNLKTAIESSAASVQ